MTVNPRYKVSKKDFKTHGFEHLLKGFEGSAQAVMAIYNDHEFQPWLFKETPKGIFLDKDTRLKYVTWLVSKLRLPSSEALRPAHFNRYRGGDLLVLYKGNVKKVLDSLQESNANTPSREAARDKTPQLVSFAHSHRSFASSSHSTFVVIS